jgi:flagellar biogenesis protein FliO
MRPRIRLACAPLFVALALVVQNRAHAAGPPPAAPQPVAAEAPEAPVGPGDYREPWPEPPNIGGVLGRLAMGTVVVLVLCVVTLVFGKRWLGGAVAKAGGGGTRLKLKESVPLGHRCFLHLVEVDGTRVLAATDAAGVKTLIPLPHAFDGLLDQQLPDDATIDANRPTAAYN